MIVRFDSEKERNVWLGVGSLVAIFLLAWLLWGEEAQIERCVDKWFEEYPKAMTIEAKVRGICKYKVLVEKKQF